MTILSIHSATAQLQYLHVNRKSSLIDEVDELVRQYEAKPLDREAIAVSGRQLIERFNHLIQENREQNLSLARVGLFRLLKLDIEEVQLKTIQILQTLLRIDDLLSYDVRNNQSQQFIDLEKMISEVIACRVRVPYTQTLLSLLEVYIGVLERLWLIPYLIDNPSSNSLKIEKNEAHIFHPMNQWIDLLLKNEKENQEFKTAAHMIQYLLKNMSTPSSYIVEKINLLKPQLYSVSLTTLIGDIYRESGNGEEAFKRYKNNLDSIVSFKLEDPTQGQQLKNAENLIWNRLGTFYNQWKNSHKDIEHYLRHLQSAQKIKDQERVGQCYGCIGSTYLVLKDYQKSIEYQEKKLKIAQEINDLSMSGVTYREMGNISFALKDFNKAIEHYEKYLKIALEDEDKQEAEYAYINLGITYQSLEEYHKAIEMHEVGLKIAGELQDKATEVKAYCKLGVAYYHLGEYRKAIEIHEKYLKITKDLQDKASEVKAYCNLGLAYYRLGEYRTAIEMQEKYLKMAEDLQDKASVGKAYANLGAVYLSLGEVGTAIEMHKKHLKIAEELKDTA